MKKELLLGVAIGALAIAGPAAAQTSPSLTVFNWSGFYAGVNGGYSWGRAEINYNEPVLGGFGIPPNTNIVHTMNGGVAGFQGGYNIQAGAWVFGLETDFDWTGQRGAGSRSYTYPRGFEGAPGQLTVAVRTTLDWLGTTRGRFGWLVTPTTMVYTTAGLAYGGVHLSGMVTDTGCTPSCVWSFGGTRTLVGYAAGTGIEGAIPNMPKWTWRAEYLYVNLGSMSGTGFDTDFFGPFSWNAKVTDNIFRLGLNLKLP